ncbi:hypothetical protein OUZ56_030955 [Daphnia magna]|uniref:Uncharacterized protein n=1 Tax=Daphnia magna TaxID=35525 RepID=A0ABQ9ZST4_9CRUS|nr:hypothetical protein OUZ56_030955 [Daphnia magna]
MEAFQSNPVGAWESLSEKKTMWKRGIIRLLINNSGALKGGPLWRKVSKRGTNDDRRVGGSCIAEEMEGLVQVAAGDEKKTKHGTQDNFDLFAVLFNSWISLPRIRWAMIMETYRPRMYDNILRTLDVPHLEKLLTRHKTI